MTAHLAQVSKVLQLVTQDHQLLSHQDSNIAVIGRLSHQMSGPILGGGHAPLQRCKVVLRKIIKISLVVLVCQDLEITS